MRLFKDHALDRVKAFNVIAILDAIATSLEEYYKRKLRMFADTRLSTQRLFLEKVMKQTAYITHAKIERISETEFYVPSEQDPLLLYYVDIQNCLCSCDSGRWGKFCKHQAGVCRLFNIKSFNLPAVTAEDKYEAAKLAFGDDVPPLSFYRSFKSVQCEEMENTNTVQMELEDMNASVSNNASVHVEKTVSTAASAQEIEELKTIIGEKCTQFEVSTAGLKKYIAAIKKIESSGQLESFFHNVKPPLRYRSGAKIKVNATSAQRRKCITRGSKRLTAGRPAKLESKIKKRRRQLGQNINLNLPNAH
jgi:hypothetical protein